MSDQASLEKVRQDESPNSCPTPSPLSKETEWNRNIYGVIGLFSLIQIGCFFLPWIRILFADASGYQLQQLPDNEMKLLWLIPIAALASLLSAISKTRAVHTAQIAGTLPFLALLYFALKIGVDLFQVLDFGAWLTLLFGAVLFVLPHCLKKPHS